MNIQYCDEEATFYFVCETCGEPIKDRKGVVDFPMAFSRNKKKEWFSKNNNSDKRFRTQS